MGWRACLPGATERWKQQEGGQRVQGRGVAGPSSQAARYRAVLRKVRKGALSGKVVEKEEACDEPAQPVPLSNGQEPQAAERVPRAGVPGASGGRALCQGVFLPCILSRGQR